eukprot:Pgem_evm1s2758
MTICARCGQEQFSGSYCSRCGAELKHSKLDEEQITLTIAQSYNPSPVVGQR